MGRHLTMNGDNPEKLSLLSVRPPRRRYLWPLFFLLAMFAGVLYERWLNLSAIPPDSAKDFRLMAEAWNIIHHYYVDQGAVQSTNLTHAAIAGMAESLGDSGHTIYLTPEMRKHESAAMRSKFTGVGVEIKTVERRTVVVAALDGSPALRAGIHAGDIILEVDGRSVAGLPTTELQERISGEIGQPVRIGVLDPADGRRKEFNIVRASIKVPNVSWHTLPGGKVAHLRIALFSDGTGRDVRNVLREIKAQDINRIVLDLRNNPGGVVDEAVAVASQFLQGGDVYLSKDAKGNITHETVKPGGLATNMSVVVLINGGSASASEIVAGALSDAHRATLVGRTTFGTGTVLSQFPLGDGSALLLAVGEWLTPGGKTFWHKGIKPDEEVGSATNTFPLIPSMETNLTSETLEASGDIPLQRALFLLSNAPDNPTNSSGSPK